MARISILFLFICCMVLAAAAQTGSSYSGDMESSLLQNRSDRSGISELSLKKWSLSAYTGIAAVYNPYWNSGRSGLMLPVGVQLNRQLTPNWSAFTAISAAPGYVPFSRSFQAMPVHAYSAGMFEGRLNPFQPAMRADLGLRYVNDAKTFSVSGSFGIERRALPVLSLHPQQNVKPYPIR